MTPADDRSEPQRASSAYEDFTRADWARLRSDVGLSLTDEELHALRGADERVSLAECADVYLPLSRLLNLRVTASQGLRASRETFLGIAPSPAPFIIGTAGSVAVGKSTPARILPAPLARWDNHPPVAPVTTDGFLLPNEGLDAK